jgi:hypothetical protein
METVISKRNRKPLRERDIIVPCEPDMTLDEVLERCPFTRKKHEKAVVTLAKYPIPEEILMRRRQQMEQFQSSKRLLMENIISKTKKP